jgi:hypothetical protein
VIDIVYYLQVAMSTIRELQFATIVDTSVVELITRTECHLQLYTWVAPNALMLHTHSVTRVNSTNIELKFIQ